MLVLVSDELWGHGGAAPSAAAVDARGGRPHVSDRLALNGILFVLRTGIPRNMLPAAGPWASGPTCRRRPRDWQHAGVWARLHRVLLDQLGVAEKIDWRRAALDSASIPARGVRRDDPASHAPKTRAPRIEATRDRSGTRGAGGATPRTTGWLPHP